MPEKSPRRILEECHGRLSLALGALAGGELAEPAAVGLRLTLEDVARDIEAAGMGLEP